MNKRVAAFAILISLVIIDSATSEDAGRVPPEYGQKTSDRSGFVLPYELARNTDMINELIKNKNEFEFTRESQPVARYNDDGTLSSAIYSDGTIVRYGYEKDGEGKIESLSLQTNEWKVVFTNGNVALKEGSNKNIYSNNDTEAKIDNNIRDVRKESEPIDKIKDKVAGDDKDKDIKKEPYGGVRDKKPVVVFYPNKKIDLDVVARKPIRFDFKEITKVLSKAEDMKRDAINEYNYNSKQYYESVETELISRKLIDEGVKYQDEQTKRESVDRVVEAAYIQYRKDQPDPSLKEFMLLERVMRKEILIPAKELYMQKMGVMQECVIRIIEQIIESKLAVYLNLSPDGDKMDAVVSLQGSSQ